MTSRVVVVGAGIAGLTSAYELLRGADPPMVTVIDDRSIPGGLVQEVEVGGLTLEAGPDSFVGRKPWAAELCRELGLEVIPPAASGAYIWTDRGLRPLPPMALGIPADVDDLARWPGLSRGGRLRALRDLVRKPRPDDGRDESIGSLCRRRLGDEATEVLVDPVLGGLFAGDVDRLSVRATFPELINWERGAGSLIRGARAALRAGASTGAAPMFLKPAGGMRRLIEALVEAVGPQCVVLGRAASSIEREGRGFVVRAADTEHSADAVVMATPALATGKLLRRLAPQAIRPLEAIPSVSTGVAILVYPSGTADALPLAAGFLVPKGRASVTAGTWISRKWPREEFGTRAVLRCFIGGAGSEDILDAADEDILPAVARHLAAVLDLPHTPEAARVIRWPHAMPQYEVGHLDRVAAIERALPEGIFVVGSAYRGVGIADGVRQAGEIAERVRAHLAGEPTREQERVP